jgi:hypothetical protein
MARFSFQDHDDDGDNDDNEADDEHAIPSFALPSASSLMQVLTSRTKDESDDKSDDDDYNDDNDVDDDDDDGNDQAMQLVSSSSLSSSRGKAPIHYHIYYSEPRPHSHSSSALCFTNCAWILFSLVAVVSHILYWYGPSVPPEEQSSSLTWGEFVQEQSQLVASVLSAWWQVGHYISFWCWQGMKHDIQLQQERRGSDEAASGCHWATATSTTTSTATLNVPPIFGQDVAWNRAQTTLSRWNHESPLVFYVTGGPGVGKRHLAYTIAKAFLIDCSTPSTTTSSDGLLEIDYLQSQSQDHHHSHLKERLLLEERLLEHVTDHPNGSVILLTHVGTHKEDRSGSYADGNTTPATTTTMLSSLLSSSSSSFLQEHRHLFSNTLLIVTSNVGKATMDKTLRHYGHDRVPMVELESYLTYEIAERHGLRVVEEEDDDDKGGPAATSTTTTSTSEHADAALLLLRTMTILPMFPLDRPAMADMLQFQLQQALLGGGGGSGSRLLIINDEEAALTYLLDHALGEWTTWIHKPTGEELLTFCSQGGTAVTRLIERIPIHECTSSGNDNVLVLEMVSNGRFRGLACPSHIYESMVLVESSSSLSSMVHQCQPVCQFSL